MVRFAQTGSIVATPAPPTPRALSPSSLGCSGAYPYNTFSTVAAFPPPLLFPCEMAAGSHPDYFSDDAGETEFTSGVDICGGRDVTGTCVIGALRLLFQ